jgi:hypothetical protein
MLTCLPQSLCSWNYVVTDEAQRESVVSMDYLFEHGSIVHSAVEYVIVREGWLGGRWSLNDSTGSVTQAVKTGFLVRQFDLLTRDGEFALRGHTFSRAFDIHAGPAMIGTIAPLHAFTRRASITCSNEMSVPNQLFCFWLAAMTWRRLARDNSGSAAATT